jgi:energy-coupling factor transporter transmembrane protein EcfT
LIFGFFTPRDLIVCGVGGLLTLVILVVLKDPAMWELILAVLPLLTAATLVFPIANYHNVLQLLINIFSFIFNRKKYYWKGWCVKDGTND